MKAASPSRTSAPVRIAPSVLIAERLLEPATDTSEPLSATVACEAILKSDRSNLCIGTDSDAGSPEPLTTKVDVGTSAYRAGHPRQLQVYRSEQRLRAIK